MLLKFCRWIFPSDSNSVHDQETGKTSEEQKETTSTPAKQQLPTTPAAALGLHGCSRTAWSQVRCRPPRTRAHSCPRSAPAVNGHLPPRVNTAFAPAAPTGISPSGGGLRAPLYAVTQNSSSQPPPYIGRFPAPWARKDACLPMQPARQEGQHART